MDPNACWADLSAAVEHEEWVRACELASALVAWVDRGGFLPTITGNQKFDRIVLWETCDAVLAWDVAR